MSATAGAGDVRDANPFAILLRAQGEWTRMFAQASSGLADQQMRVARSWLGFAPGAAGQLAGPHAAARKLRLRIEDVVVGTQLEYARAVRDDDIRAFAEATGDENPAHLSDEYAKRTMFGERIAHGMLTAGIVSAALSRLPGVVIYLGQELRFTKPVRPGDVVTARLRVVERIGDKPRFRLSTTCANQAGEVVLDGEAVVLLMPEAK